jgi:hypothetical protein
MVRRNATRSAGRGFDHVASVTLVWFTRLAAPYTRDDGEKK